MLFLHPRSWLGHVDLDVVGHVAEDRVVAAGFLQNRTWNAGVNGTVGHKTGNEALPGDSAPEIAVEPEGAPARHQDFPRSYRGRLRGHPAPVPSETVLAVLCLEVMQASTLGYWLVVIIFSAIFAAIMSTADSAMLSISSMVTQDLYGQYIRPGADQKHLTKIGKWTAWALMIPIAGFAIWYEGTLIQLLKLLLVELLD